MGQAHTLEGLQGCDFGNRKLGELSRTPKR